MSNGCANITFGCSDPSECQDISQEKAGEFFVEYFNGIYGGVNESGVLEPILLDFVEEENNNCFYEAEESSAFIIQAPVIIITMLASIFSM